MPVDQLTLHIMEMVRNGHQGEEAVIYVAYLKIICAVGVEHRDKGNALFHINLWTTSTDPKMARFYNHINGFNFNGIYVKIRWVDISPRLMG